MSSNERLDRLEAKTARMGAPHLTHHAHAPPGNASAGDESLPQAAVPPSATDSAPRFVRPVSPRATSPAGLDYRNPDLQAAIRHLPLLVIDYNKPTSLPFNRPTVISLQIESASLGAAQGAQAAIDQLDGVSVRETGIRLAPEVGAVLSGPPDDVTITPRYAHQQQQRMNLLGNTTWYWDVTPKRPGKTKLTLELWTTVHLPSSVAAAPVKTFTNTIPVQMGVIDRVQWDLHQIDPIVQWLIGIIAGFGAAFAAWKWLVPGSSIRPSPTKKHG